MKYTDIRIDDEIYCSSSCDYSIRVYCKSNGERDPRKIYFLFWGFDTDTSFGYVEFPKYFTREVQRQVLALLKSGKARFYEYDRDGNKRYENLRYHDDEWTQAVIAGLERIEAGE